MTALFSLSLFLVTLPQVHGKADKLKRFLVPVQPVTDNLSSKRW